MYSASESRPREAGFDLTPMIDIVMLLIVFFTLTSQFTRNDQRAVDLPRERGESAEHVAPSTLFLDMDADGRLSEGGEMIELDDVAARVAKSKASNPSGGKADLMLRADRRCTAAQVNRVASALAKAGVKVWKIATTTEGAAPATELTQ